MVKGKSAIEVYMKNKYLFPYDYLDDAKEELSQNYKYNIYFVLKGHRYSIINIDILNSIEFAVNIVDLVSEKRFYILLNINFFLQLPSLDYVDLKVTSNNDILQVDFSKLGMQYLHEFVPNYMRNNANIIRKYGTLRLQFHSKKLIDLYYRAIKQEHTCEYDVLYIGQSIKDNIYERLSHHETIQKIIRDFNREDFSYKHQIYIMVSGVSVNHFTQNNIYELNSIFLTRKKLKNNFAICNENISKETVVDIAEAMLISFFKPNYNRHYKNTTKLQNLKKYSIFLKNGVNPIYYSLDLYFEECKEKMILKTSNISTKFKANLIKCEFNSEDKIESLVLDHFNTDIYV